MHAHWTRATTKPRCHGLALAVAVLLFASMSCSSGTTITPTGVGNISISPQPLTIAQGATVTFACSSSITSSAPCDWDLVGDAAGNLGSPSALSGSNTFRYTAPATPPIYAAPDASTSQGVVNIQAYYGYASATIAVAITAPSVTVGILNPVSSLALGEAVTLNGYAVGNVNNRLTWQVNGVTGGSTAAGTIVTPYNSTTATYDAPTAIPMTGSSVTITAVSQADPTKTASIVIVLH